MLRLERVLTPVHSKTGEVHLLLGTTFNSVTERGDYDSAKHSAMAPTELERWLIFQVAGVYHLRLHAAL